jgi:hypothetical protein
MNVQLYSIQNGPWKEFEVRDMSARILNKEKEIAIRFVLTPAIRTA